MSYRQELFRVIIHGILHLCGINDKGPGEREIMEAAENQSLDLLREIAEKAGETPFADKKENRPSERAYMAENEKSADKELWHTADDAEKEVWKTAEEADRELKDTEKHF